MRTPRIPLLQCSLLVKRQWLFAALLLGFLIWLIAGFMAPSSWQLSLEGKSELVSMDLAGTTQWDIGTAVVCVPLRGQQSGAQASGVIEAANADLQMCNGDTWHALGGVPHATGRSLKLLGAPGNEIHVVAETHHDGSVLMVLRTKDRARPLGQMEGLDSSRASTVLPSRINVMWRAAPADAVRRTMILPFTGDVTIGRDVSWSSEKMLLGGRLSIFAASEESLTGRTLAEEAVLLLGDQVQLKGQARGHNTWVAPKGFIRFGADRNSEPFVLDVVAFAPAEGATIMRFGGGKYGFSPGWWARIRHKSTLVITLAVVAGMLTLLASLANILQFLPLGGEWLSKRRRGRGREA